MKRFARISVLAAAFSIAMSGLVRQSNGGDRSDVSEVSIVTAASLSEPVSLGQQIFEHNFDLPHTWKGAEPLGQGGDGLGPQFNDVSCVACHRQGGVGGAGPNEKNALILSVIAAPGMEARSIQALVDEAHRQHVELSSRQTSTVLHRFGLPTPGDERAYDEYLTELFDRLSFESDRFEAVQGKIGAAQFEISQRNTTALWGVGAIDELRRKEGNGIRRHLMDEQNRKYPWLSGRVPRDSIQRDGWFGWRGQMASLHDFNLGACATEMGLTVPGKPQHPSPVAELDQAPPALDLSEQQAIALSLFVASLPAPQQVLPESRVAADRVALGEEVFNQCHCNACHVRTLGWIDGIYSDLLLHDMGPKLCDHSKAVGELIPGETLPGPIALDKYYGSMGNLFNPPRMKPTNCECEWRTPPLWGCADSAPYLHDGRASTLEDAIGWHGGEAETSLQAYELLPPAERSLLLGFLDTLRAPQQTAPARTLPELAAIEPAATVEALRPVAAELPAAAPVAAIDLELDPPDGLNQVEVLPPVESTTIGAAAHTALTTLLERLEPTAANAERAAALSTTLDEALPQPGAGQFARALFEIRSLKHRDALARLTGLTHRPGPYGAKARLALVHEDLRRRDYGAALSRLEAHGVETAQDQSLSARDLAEQAEAIGVLFAWMAGPSGIDAARFAVDDVRVRTRAALPERSVPFFDAGLTRVEEQFAALQAEREALTRVEQAEQQAELEAVFIQRGELSQKEAELQLTRQEQQEQFDAELKKLDLQLGDLEKQYVEKEEIERRLLSEVQPRELRILGIINLLDGAVLRAGSPVNLELAALQDQAALLNRKRQLNTAQARVIGLKAQQLVQQRAKLVADHQQKTGQAAKELASLSKWQERFEKQAEEIGSTPTRRSKRVQKLSRDTRELGTYARFDASEEARRMLARYRVEE